MAYQPSLPIIVHHPRGGDPITREVQSLDLPALDPTETDVVVPRIRVHNNS